MSKPEFTVPSSSLSLTLALSGGLRAGRIAEFYGPEEGGKTGIALDFIANAQKQKLRVCFIDAERALDLEYARLVGVDLAFLDLVVPGEKVGTKDYTDLVDGAKIMDTVVEKVEQGFQVIVIDSVDALSPPREMAKGMEDASNIMGLKAHFMGTVCRKLLKHRKVLFIFINQIRETMEMWGPKITTPGGRALKFYASYRLQVERSMKKEDIITSLVTGEVRGHKVKFKLVKNKTGRRSAGEFWFDYYKGILVRRDHAQTAKRLGVILQAGKTFSFMGFKDQSLPNLMKRIYAEKDALAQLKAQCAAVTQDVYAQLVDEEEDYD